MLARSELNALAQWCHGNAVSWMPAAADCGRPAMILERRDLERRGHRPSWKRLVLILEDEGFRLVTEKGETLASASDLPAVLDAVSDGARPAPPRAAPRREAARTQASAVFVF